MSRLRALRTAIARRLVDEERGQVMIMLATGLLVVLLGAAALTIDYGRAVNVQRKLQASADAAALAGAQKLPNAAAARSTASGYGSSGSNPVTDVIGGEPTETIAAACSTGGSSCAVKNAVVVRESARVDTAFGKVVGVDSIGVGATGAACRPCGTKPLDIMLLLDRTYSMCEDDAGNLQAGCPDLQNARDGIETFLGYLDPSLDWVGLAVTPPARFIDPNPANWNSRCTSTSTLLATESSGFYPTSTLAGWNTDENYVLVSARNDYKSADGSLDLRSPLLNALENCVQAGGSTAYALALEQANADLQAHGRPGVQKVIVFLSDGGANSAQQSVLTPSAPWSPYIVQPCARAVQSAQTVKNSGTTIYTIGYDVASTTTFGNSQMQCFQAPHGSVGFLRAPEVPSIAARDALRSIATSPAYYYERPTPGEVETIYAQIAGQLGGTKLIPVPPGT